MLKKLDFWVYGRDAGGSNAVRERDALVGIICAEDAAFESRSWPVGLLLHAILVSILIFVAREGFA
jgi:hypothetical protein